MATWISTDPSERYDVLTDPGAFDDSVNPRPDHVAFDHEVFNNRFGINPDAFYCFKKVSERDDESSALGHGAGLRCVGCACRGRADAGCINLAVVQFMLPELVCSIASPVWPFWAQAAPDDAKTAMSRESIVQLRLFTDVLPHAPCENYFITKSAMVSLPASTCIVRETSLSPIMTETLYDPGARPSILYVPSRSRETP